MNKKKVLIIDDDEHICELVQIALEADGIKVEKSFDGDTGLKKALQGDYDALILDLMLPGKDGWEICRKIRSSEARSIPIVMLTAKGEEVDKILGLELGADDYITKPFSPRELVARVKALLRRAEDYNIAENIVRAGNLVIKIDRYEVKVGEQKVELTPKEFEVLALMARNSGRIFERETLLRKVWGYDYQGSTRTIDEHIKRLRSKLFAVDKKHTYIQTVWGVGYKFEVKEL
ncbi:MAG: response regulator transcription factor [Dethiobacteria bacterium]